MSITMTILLSSYPPPFVSHCIGLGLGVVQEMGMTQLEAMGPCPCPCPGPVWKFLHNILEKPLIPSPVPVLFPVQFSRSVNIPEIRENRLLRTRSPMAVRLMLSSWFCRPNLPATSTQICRQGDGMIGRKSVTTSCRLWKATRIRFSLEYRKYW